MSGTGHDPFSRLLYPMLRSQPQVGPEVLAELARAPLQKSDEANRLRRQLLAEQGGEIAAAAELMARALRDGGRILTCGNGGSATSAADIVSELLVPAGPRVAARALCLTNDVATLTAVGNDVSFDDVFVRQLIALGRPADVVLAISTSGNSENLVRVMAEARSRRMPTIAICGYDGGRLAREVAVDHCLVVRSASVHRIQEVQATLYHCLVELVQDALMEEPACASQSRPS
ncbi:MAG: D-sedoheptulose-7-phosphate isomerase [Candidatus Dormibacteria bacterium]